MKLTSFEEKDFLTLYDYMYPLWHDTYGGIIPKAQIDLLLDKYFSAEGIEHYRSAGYEYFKLDDNGKVGVVVICEKNGTTYLDKLYLSHESRGKGYPTFVFGELLKLGRDITLNVNQGNERALKCYFKNGFTIDSEETIDLGNGMVNKDYNLRLTKENFEKSKC